LSTSRLGLYRLWKNSETEGSDQKIDQYVIDEIKTDFPFLNSQYVVHLWGSLESLVMSSLAATIHNEPAFLDLKEIKRIKISVSEYEKLGPYDRAYYLIKQLDNSLDGPFKRGVERFEGLLKVFGLDGDVPDTIKKTLFELQQVRNVLVHKGGIVDLSLVGSCPWLGLSVGENFKIDLDKLKIYFDSVFDYVTLLIDRLVGKQLLKP
jgi:hypothetical protein